MQNILSLIPQRPPFVMIDEILYCDESHAQCSFLITPSNIFVENNKFNEAGLLENMAQTAAAREGYFSVNENKKASVGYIASVKNFQVFSLPKVNDCLMTEIKLISVFFDFILIEGKVMCNEKIIAECEMKIFIEKIAA